MKRSHDPGLVSDLHYKLARLREMLQLERDLEEISTYFHTILVPDDDFVFAGKRARHPRLVEALRGVLSALATGGELGAPLILRIEAERMCHGYVSCGRGYALFFYFESLEVGFCSFLPSLSSPAVTFSRFALRGDTRVNSWNTAPRGSG